MTGQGEAFAEASPFRSDFYACLDAHRDELFELTDALIVVVFDAGYDAPRPAHLLGGLPVDVLVRQAGDLGASRIRRPCRA